jgi:protoporphyrinogen oxidase
MKQIIILGAGIAGMTIALELKKTALHRDSHILIIEKAAQAGGLLNGTEWDGHNFDNGCYVYNTASTIVKRYPQLFVPAAFNWKIWLNNKFTHYPPNFQTLTRDSNARQKLSLITSLLLGRLTNLVHPPRNAKEWFNQNLGKRMVAETHLNGYLEKLQGLEADKVHVSLCNTRLVELKLPLWELFKKQFLHKIFKPRPKTPAGIKCYPSGGTGNLARHIYRECLQAGIEFRFNSYPLTISVSNSSYEITLNDAQLSADTLYSTIPLSELIKTLISDPVFASYPIPRYTTLYVPMLVVKKMSLPGDYVILYSFEKNHLWKRTVGIRQPDGNLAVIVEVNLAQPIPPEEQVTLQKTVISQLTGEIGLFAESDIIFASQKTVPFAYPLYQLDTYDKILELQSYIKSKCGIILIGRQSRFDYISSNQTVEQVLASITTR